MAFFKKLVKNKGSLAWAITTVATTALLTTATILASTFFKTLMNNIFDGPRAITKAGENVNAFEQDFDTKEEAYANGNAVCKEICEEGMVLLKNDNNALPLAKSAKVSIFGKNSVNLVTGGSGSAAPKQDEPVKTIYDSLTAAGFECNPTLKDFYMDNGKSGDGRPANPSMSGGGVSTLATGETPYASYTEEVKSSYNQYKDAAIVVFSRIAGENWDLPRFAADNEEHHYLQIDNNETEMLRQVCNAGFKHVIVLINSSNMIDLGFLKFQDDPAYNSKIDAAMIIGSVGANGIMALGEILCGDVNPSGHTVDTLYTHYENDPVWQNFGDNRSTDGKGDSYIQGGKQKQYYFVEYEEDIYVGYRYYETRGHEDGETWYENNVVYPFGHGLSYTTFSREISNKGALGGALSATEKFTVDVKVKNTGNVAGKDVVQLYASAPYTAGGIEKPFKVLVGFAKTSLLKPNQEEVISIEVNPYDFASYDYNDANNNNFCGYELEAGNYTFYASTDAHHSFESVTRNLPESVKIEKDPVTGVDVVNHFDDADDFHTDTVVIDDVEVTSAFTQMSRADFAGTFPKSPNLADRTVTKEWLDEQKDYTSNNPNEYTVMPETGKEFLVDDTDEEGKAIKRSILLKDMIGKDYNDPIWENFLSTLTPQDYLDLFNGGSYSTAPVEHAGVPATISCDGPTGIVAFMGSPAVYGTCYYCSEILVAQTYNLELADKEGSAIGNEALLGDQRPDGTHMPYTGWYSPAVNIHRSPFSGRNTEYYSEDPFINGKFAAHVCAAAQEKGVYTTVKHFALNDQETHRSINGSNTWCNEQAIREIYLRPFEMAVKEGHTKGIMSSFNRIGKVWTGGDYRLLTNVLREEWGFTGLVICDFHTDPYMNNVQMCYAGGDLNLTTDKPWTNADFSKAGDVTVLRQAAHNTLWVLANSNAMRLEILGYRLPVWQEVLFIVDGVIAAGLIVWGVFALRPLFKKDPEEAKK